MGHAERVAKHRAFMEGIGAPTTEENYKHLADKRAKSARKLRGKTSANARLGRLGALNSARAFYTLAREAARKAAR